MQLKPNNVAEIHQRIEKDILPLLRKQTGFRTKSHSSSRWNGSVWNQFVENKENAEAYNRGSYSEVAKDPGESG